MLSMAGRRLRAAATIAVFGALLAGSIWGQDDHFPFGPFRMYSTTTTDEVTVVRFEAVADGAELELRSRDFGLRPAELHGQIARFDDERALLVHLVDAYEALHPERPALDELRLIKGYHRLDDGRPTAYDEATLAVWQRG